MSSTFRTFIKKISTEKSEEQLDSTIRYDLNYVTLLIKIRLKGGQGLAIRDASGSSDPYVKFKYKDSIFYKSSTIFKNLNPIWDEEFQMLADDMTTPIIIEVFDYDRFCTDDFMGEAAIDLSQIKWFTPVEMYVSLKDEASPNEQLGTISLSVCVVPQTQEEKIQICNRTFDPKWVEQFDLHIYDNSSEILEVMCHDKKTNSSIGRMSVDLSSLPRDQTLQKWYNLEESAGSVLLLITVSGAQSKDSVVDLTEFNQKEFRNSVIQKYDFLHTYENIKDIGQLTVKVFRGEDLQAKDIGGKSDPFAVLDSVKDIHTCLEITVYDEDPNNKFEFLGKVAIPLLSIQNCERRWYALKDKKLQTRAKGEILVEMDIIWNPASLFRNTVMELKEFGLAVVDYKNYVQSCFDWDSTPRSITAFSIFIFSVYWIEIYHIPILLLMLFIKGYIYKMIAEGITPCHEPVNFKEDDEAEEEKKRHKTTPLSPHRECGTIALKHRKENLLVNLGPSKSSNSHPSASKLTSGMVDCDFCQQWPKSPT
uniref:C2 domain-containing protein n=1 Tax=Heterorhabditis bacteriophora TaxID=37862 RepID=A0A1I7XQF2_HETBA